MKHGVRVIEFTVAPQVTPLDGKEPYHEWLVAFDKEPTDYTSFCVDLDKYMCTQNIYYKDLIAGKILRPCQITVIESNGFRKYMKEEGKLGGQNKVPRLSNDRNIAEKLKPYVIKKSHN
jgi:hypothetical protein